MGFLKVLLLSLYTVGNVSVSLAEEASAPAVAQAPPVPGVQEPKEDNTEFRQDVDDFEKNMAKEVPPAEKAAKEANAVKARAQMKEELAKSAKKNGLKKIKPTKSAVKKSTPKKKKPKTQDNNP